MGVLVGQLFFAVRLSVVFLTLCALGSVIQWNPDFLINLQGKQKLVQEILSWEVMVVPHYSGTNGRETTFFGLSE